MDIKDTLIRLVLDFLSDHEQASEDIKTYIAEHATDKEYADIIMYLRDVHNTTLNNGDFANCDFVIGDEDDYLEDDENWLHISKDITGDLDDYFGEFFTIGFSDKITACDDPVIHDYQLVDATKDYYIFQ